MTHDKKKIIYSIIAVLTCPCHLFILAALAAGSVFGSIVNAYFIPLAVILSLIFFFALYKALR